MPLSRLRPAFAPLPQRVERVRRAGFLPAAVRRLSDRGRWACLAVLLVLAGLLVGARSPSATSSSTQPWVDEARRELARLEVLQQRSDELGRLLDRLEAGSSRRVALAAGASPGTTPPNAGQ
jgi:hypothetical protein